MATFRINEGTHYHSWPPISTLPWLGPQMMVRSVTFDMSCAYDSDAYHALDVNKLFGLSFGFGGVHYNSARFGWRYSKELESIELLAYCYNEGRRNNDLQLNFPIVARVGLGQTARCSIILDNDQDKGPIYAFNVSGAANGTARVPCPSSLPSFGLTHGPFFGGVLPAPHDMSIIITRT